MSSEDPSNTWSFTGVLIIGLRFNIEELRNNIQNDTRRFLGGRHVKSSKKRGLPELVNEAIEIISNPKAIKEYTSNHKENVIQKLSEKFKSISSDFEMIPIEYSLVRFVPGDFVEDNFKRGSELPKNSLSIAGEYKYLVRNLSREVLELIKEILRRYINKRKYYDGYYIILGEFADKECVLDRDTCNIINDVIDKLIKIGEKHV